MSRVSVALRPFSLRLTGRTARAVAVVTAVALPFAGCTAAQKASTSSSYVIIQSLQGASGATPDKLSGVLASDVVTNVKVTQGSNTVLVPTVYEDPGQVIFKLGLKDPGTADSPTQPSTNNFITINRYHVNYVRADGRATPGVDVPYPFDGAFTATVTNDGATANLTLVRIQAKEEAPLKQLAGAGGALAISTIAQVTFYGADQSGREVSAQGQISVTFADWGDPQ